MGASAMALLPVILLSASLVYIQGALATVTPYLVPGFHFDYSNSQQPSIPITSQCETIHLEWTRNSNDTGPLPIAPYFFQVYTSTSQTPFVVYAGFGSSFDWDVPFVPNTQYQICMFDSAGVSGGCQATYTVIPNTTVTTPTCQNVTAPSELSVSGTTPLGALSQYSYIDQCSSLSVMPKTGKAPFTLTVAPSFHPPYNLTSHSMDPISWLVSLPVGYHFFLALSSSDGLLWANGPMQVGGLGPTDCLAPGTISKKDAVSMIVGTSIGGTVLGLILGVLAYILFTKFQRRRQRSPSQKYFASQHFSSIKQHKAPSIVPSTVASSPSSSSAPPVRAYQPIRSSALHPTPSLSQSQSSRTYSFSSLPMSDFPAQTSRTSNLPLEPLRLNRQSRPLPEPEPSIFNSSDAGSERESFPLDVKRRPPLPDDASTVSSPSTPRFPPSVARSSYARHPRHSVYVIDETEVADVPPEYGRHTDDTSCTPSIISSGRVPTIRRF